MDLRFVILCGNRAICVDSCVQYEVDHIDRCYSSKLVAFVDTVDLIIQPSFPESSLVFRSFTREIPPRAFREWPIAIKRNETAEKVKRRKTEKKGRSEKRQRTRQGRRYARLRERKRERERKRGEGGREKEHAHRAGT